jgi:hypothetical protein
MFKALVVKELRESAGIVALAALAILYALSGLTGMGLFFWQARSIYTYPFVNDGLAFYVAACIGGLAIALGLKQTAWEVGQGTHFFLFHRPVSRNRVFASKLVVGLGWVLMMSVLLILIYAWWAMTPGHFPAPFDWSMTVPAWQLWLSMPIVYLGAFVSGIRPGKWFGMRLAPLVAAIFVAAAASWFPLWWLTLLVSLAAIVVFNVSIFYYAHARDY